MSSKQISKPSHWEKIFSLECVPNNIFSYFSTKIYVVGTKKNRLNETVLLSTQKHRLKRMGKRISTILRSAIFVSNPVMIMESIIRYKRMLVEISKLFNFLPFVDQWIFFIKFIKT